MKKIIVLLLLLNFNNCKTSEIKKEVYRHSSSTGCSVYIKNDERLKCLSNMISEFEDLQNSEITVENEMVERVDEEYVKYKETYCYVSPKTNRKYLCFESVKNLYEPTTFGKIWNFTKTIGLGAVIGFASGVYSLN